ncbi:MAG TPA: EamA family transporter [Methylomirabilota bacterium]|nr:EamA family transporter [Methylomirabilota bacterium]
MTLLVLFRVVLSVSANAIQKRLLKDRAGISITWILTYGLILAPAFALALLGGFPSEPAFWRDSLLGGGLDALGNIAMVAALRSTDLSVFGPLNAFRPIIALFLGWVFLGEAPTISGIGGIVITVGGAVILLDRKQGNAGEFRWKPLALRALGLSLGVFGAVFLKRAASLGTAQATVAAWTVCGLLALLCYSVLTEAGMVNKLQGDFRAHRAWLLAHAATFLLMQILTVRIFQTTLLAYSFVFFQLGMVLQVFVGRFIFDEPAFGRRVLAAIIMAAGSFLILWKG